MAKNALEIQEVTDQDIVVGIKEINWATMLEHYREGLKLIVRVSKNPNGSLEFKFIAKSNYE